MEVKKSDHRTQLILKVDQLDSDIQKERMGSTILAPLETAMQIVDQVLQANRTSESLKEFREQVGQEDSPWTLEDGLLLY